MTKEQRRLHRSCEECRSSKTRCAPSGDINEKCQRCDRLGRICTFAEARGRKKAKIRSTRIGNIEKNIDDIYTILAQKSQQPVVEPFGVGSAVLPPTVSSISVGASDLGEPVISQLEPAPLLTLEQLPPGRPHLSGDVLLQNQSQTIFSGLVSTQDAINILHNFKDEHHNFPFITLPSLPVHALEMEQPFLLLAILTTMTVRQVDLHESLALEFRKSLATKLVIEGIKNLDILQGLLVYLTWFHLNCSQATQIYLTSQITLSIAAELVEDANATIELKRAFVEAYILSSCICLAARRPIHMKYNNQVYICCEALKSNTRNPSDALLVQAVNLQRVAEDISALFGYESTIRPALSIETVQLSIEAFKGRLKNMDGSLFVQEFGPLSFTYDTVRIFLYEIAIYIDSSRGLGPGDEQQTLQTRRTPLLLSCLDATKMFLDRYISLPVQLMQRVSAIQKVQLGHAVIVLIKLSLCTAVGLEPIRFRQVCNVSHYIDAIASSAGSISSTPGETEHHDSFRVFEEMMARLKTWYERWESMAPAILPPGFLTMSPMQIPNILPEETQIDFDFSELDFSALDFMFRDGASLEV